MGRRERRFVTVASRIRKVREALQNQRAAGLWAWRKASGSKREASRQSNSRHELAHITSPLPRHQLFQYYKSQHSWIMHKFIASNAEQLYVVTRKLTILQTRLLERLPMFFSIAVGAAYADR
jgi:hypothetical protein